jgi:hypothetical protein
MTQRKATKSEGTVDTHATQRIVTKVSADLYKRIRIQAIEESSDVQDLVAKALEAYLESVKKEGRKH